MEVSLVLERVLAAVRGVGGIEAVVLGGSRARGTHTADSDIDIGLYYRAEALDLAALHEAARAVDDEGREGLITAPGGWGPWVNGGAWLVVAGRPVDLILRDTARVADVVAACEAGTVSAHYQTGHPHAFLNIMYRGELAVCRVLWDGTGAVSELKRRAECYPPAARRELLNLFGFEAGFSLTLAERYAESGDLYYVGGHIVRALSALNQVLFALNEQYCLNEKRAVAMIEGFAARPEQYPRKVDSVLAALGSGGGAACERLRALVAEVMALLPEEAPSVTFR